VHRQKFEVPLQTPHLLTTTPVQQFKFHLSIDDTIQINEVMSLREFVHLSQFKKQA